MKSSEAEKPAITIFGIRHHGPGCARSLRAALEEMSPDIVLIEGPPDARDVLPLIVHEQMQPPVAILIYAESDPRKAAYFPFTVFSPEWQALRFAFQQGLPARLMDLPQAIELATPEQGSEPATTPEIDRETPAATQAIAVGDPPDPMAEGTPRAAEPGESQATDGQAVREDPFGMIAKLAGYDDRELWW